MRSLILVGGGGHCRSCIDVIEFNGQYAIAGIVDQSRDKWINSEHYPYLGNDEELYNLVDRYHFAFVTVGQIKSSSIRVRLFNKLKEFGANLPVIFSPDAYVSRQSRVGRGTIIMHHAIVNAYAYIGENCIINNQALVEHDAIIESHCHISTGAKVNGGVHIGSGTFIGSGAIIRDNLKIGSNCVIGAGAVVLNELPADTLFYHKTL